MSNFVRHDDGGATYTLLCPFEHGGKEIGEIHLDKVTAKKLRSLDSANGEISKVLAFLGALANLPQGAIDKIEGPDCTELFAYVAELLGKVQETGGT